MGKREATEPPARDRRREQARATPGSGLRVAAKTNPDERTLIQRIEAALTVLD